MAQELLSGRGIGEAEMMNWIAAVLGFALLAAAASAAGWQLRSDHRTDECQQPQG